MPPGQPTKYQGEKTCHIAFEACKLGATSAELAKMLEVHIDTIYEWRSIYPEFSEALKKAKDEADNLIEKSLYNRAKGFKQIEQRTTKDGVVELEVSYAPDPTSMIFWLKNRKRKEWCDRTIQQLEGDVTHSFVTDKPLTAKEFEEQIAHKVEDDSES